jgi:hypothetical protein
MSNKTPVNPNIAAEIQEARNRFREAAAKDERLALLTLIDPIRAFEDAGITFSRSARRYLRHAYPQFQYGEKELYEGVRDGRIKIPWIKKVRVREEQDPEQE